MPDISDFISKEVPGHYRQDYPRLVLFIEKYYEWMSRRSGFSEEETQNILEDSGWMVTDLDKYMIDNRQRFSGITTDESKDLAMVQESNILMPEAALDRLITNWNADRNFDFFESNDGYVVDTADSQQYDVPYLDPAILQDWFDRLGFPYTVGTRSSGYLDEILLLRVVKHLHDIKGTVYSMELFFNIFFGESVEIYLPKFEISALDYNMVLDGDNTLRDDYYYNEYSYVIRVKGDPAKYQEIFKNVYFKYIHPTGFKVFIEQIQGE